MNLNPFSRGVKSKVDKKLSSIVPRPTPIPAPQPNMAQSKVSPPNIASRVLYTASTMGTFDMIAVMAEIKREERQEKLKSIFDEEELK